MSTRDQMENNAIGALSAVLRQQFEVKDAADFASLFQVLNTFYVSEMATCYAMCTSNTPAEALKLYEADREDLFKKLDGSFKEYIETECNNMAELQKQFEAQQASDDDRPQEH